MEQSIEEESYEHKGDSLNLWDADSSLWDEDESDFGEEKESLRVFIGEVQVIAVSRIYFEKHCLICSHFIESENEIVECGCCNTLQVTKECPEKVTAKFVVKCKEGKRITVWAYDDLRKYLKCEMKDAKKALLNAKFSAHLILDQ